MTIALCATAIVVLALLWEVSMPWIDRRLEAWRARRNARRAGVQVPYDPGRERRAEQRARELLKSCVNEEEWAMYRDLGFIRVWGAQSGGPGGGGAEGALMRARHFSRDLRGVPYAYLIYPHTRRKPRSRYIAHSSSFTQDFRSSRARCSARRSRPGS